MKFTKQMERDLWDIFHENPSTKLATKKFNDKYETNFVERSLGQRFINMKRGVEIALESQSFTEDQLQLLAKKELHILKQQKKNVALRQEAHKAAKNLGVIEMLREELQVPKTDQKPLPKVYAEVDKTKPNEIIEYLISDLHYKGSEEEWVAHIFSKIKGNIKNNEYNINHRLCLVGDTIEGGAAHLPQLFEVVSLSIQQAREVSNLFVKYIPQAFEKVKNLSILDVIESNHSEIRPLGSKRGDFHTEDLGYIINDIMRNALGNKYYFWPTVNGVVETPEGYYYHGHQNWNSKQNTRDAKLGTEKNITFGHWHHHNLTQEMRRTVHKLPSCKKSIYGYEIGAGFNPIPTVVKRKLVDGKIASVELIYL